MASNLWDFKLWCEFLYNGPGTMQGTSGSGGDHWGYLSHKHTMLQEGAGSLFMTEGKSVSAHRAQGPTPCKGCCPPGRWVCAGSLPAQTHQPGGLGSLPAGGFEQGGSLHKPTGQEGNTPYKGWALVHGGQRPISLEYQINRLPLSYLIL